ncbi:SDR family oxidoreductase [Cytobacillus spongiae]|uniref:SDR family NAD(P)-dependent oxidoreductase n=1 Tax=Cytobacillus spongiae TaxID=2901381 RepID=UPI001F46C026|nr:SDR family oxidoreductase [Cytobacillus spongiae]UII57737.1 SDR family oxidoreductase [Cytobacillus spongiae]
MTNQTVLITGASGGIGEQFAEKFAREGYDIIASARSYDKLILLKNRLEKTYHIKVHIFAKDLSIADEIDALYEDIQSMNIRVDVLINNAGFGLYGEFLETDLSQELNMIDLNIRSLTHLTKLVLRDMVKHNEGKILNVASTAAFQPGPLMAVYYATKAYVLSFTEAINNELNNTNITVSALCPGPTATGFSDRADLAQSKLFQAGVMDVETVVNIGYEQLFNKQTVIIPGFKNKLLANSIRFVPRKIVPSIVRNVQGKK